MSIDLRPLQRSDIDAASALLKVACAYDDAAVVAQEVIFGTAPGCIETRTFSAWHEGRLLGVVSTAGKWLRVLAVHPEARNTGIGTVLLAAAESDITSRGGSVARMLDQPGNYLAPGIDTRNEQTIAWLERRGWTRGKHNHNLIVDVAGNARVSKETRDAAIARCTKRGYEVGRASADDAPSIVQAVADAFSPAWAFEVERALDFAPPGVHVATHRATGALAAFAAHDGNNQGLGWFGPAGTLEPHRRNGLGAALLLSCLVDVADAGHPTCTIAWIGPRAFYDKAAGIAGERTFVVMTKKLENQ